MLIYEKKLFINNTFKLTKKNYLHRLTQCKENTFLIKKNMLNLSRIVVIDST